MQFKHLAKWLMIGIIFVFVNACVSTAKPTKTMPNEDKAALYLRMGVRYLDINMLKIAKEKLDTALSLDSNSEEIHNALGALNERLYQYDLAGQHYQQALSIDENNFSIKNNYGRFLCERDQVESGLSLLQQAIALPLNNRRWFAYTNLGRCYLIKNQLEIAESNFRQALQYNGKYPPALSEMQKVSYNKGSFLSARAFLERYLAVAKHNAKTLWYAVQTERALGNKALVDQYKRNLITQFPASKEARQLKSAVKLN